MHRKGDRVPTRASHSCAVSCWYSCSVWKAKHDTYRLFAEQRWLFSHTGWGTKGTLHLYRNSYQDECYSFAEYPCDRSHCASPRWVDRKQKKTARPYTEQRSFSLLFFALFHGLHSNDPHRPYRHLSFPVYPEKRPSALCLPSHHRLPYENIFR